MAKHKRFQHFELTDRVIRRSSGLLPFQTSDPDPNMRRSDHAYIVGAIADRQGGLIR